MATPEANQRVRKLRKAIFESLAETSSMTSLELRSKLDCTLEQLEVAMRPLRRKGLIDVGGTHCHLWYFVVATDDSLNAIEDDKPAVTIRPALPQDFKFPHYQSAMDWSMHHLLGA